MLQSMGTAMAGMEAIQGGYDVLANNIANLNTTGFKESRPNFDALMYQAHNGLATTQAGGGTQSTVAGVPSQQVGTGAGFSTQTLFDQGNILPGSGPMDLAINGAGFFQIKLADGTTAYTRSGSFQVDGNGNVVDGSGDFLQGTSGNLVVPSGASGVTVSGAGGVTTTVNGVIQNIGTINLAYFINPQGLQSLGGSLFVPSSNSGTASTTAPTTGGGTIQQGMLESSNVSLSDSMVQMILLHNGFAAGAKVLQTADQMAALADQIVV